MAAISSLYQPVIITAIREERPGVKTITLTYKNGTRIAFQAGQFITLVFTHHGKEERRSYSISSEPDSEQDLAITIKRMDNGAYSRMLADKARVGDELYTTGVAGLFTLPDNAQEYSQVFLFAAGIGITPVFSLLQTILHKMPHLSVVLVYSNRDRHEVVFYDQLIALCSLYPTRLKTVFLYSTAFNLARARLNKELVPVLLKENATTSNEKLLCFICGPFDYMRMVVYALEEAGLHAEQIKKENFNTNDRNIIVAEPPDKRSHMITLQTGGISKTFRIDYPDSILQAAKKNDILLPYSCEVGRCGSCAAKCISGEVWHSYNEVLMANDLKNGIILTCVGHPINDDITIAL